jgi:hypothetical protein
MWEAGGVYSVKSMYAIINFRGVMPVNVHCVWSFKITPKIHFFLWLMVHSKILTIDNLVKRQSVDDLTCIFCEELETCHHLLCECVVISNMWSEFKRVLGISFPFAILVAIYGLSNNKKKDLLVNMINSALLSIIWLTRNDMVFNRTQ